MPINIVFDFGAVLFTWRPHEIVRGVFPAQAGTPAAARRLADAIFHHQDWLNFDRGTVEQSVVIQRTAHRLGLPHQAVRCLVAEIPEHLTPMQDTVDLLAKLHQRRLNHGDHGDIRLYFLSNMPEPYARVLQQRHAFLQWFDGGMFSADVKVIKPQPEIFRMLESRYALAPGATLFIDDHLANVQAARALGWHGIHFESAAQLAPHLARHLG